MTNDIDPREPTGNDEERYVFVEIPRCPVCEKTKFRSLKSIDQGDGSRKKTSICKACGCRFFIILE